MQPITIPFKPLSINEAWQGGRRKSKLYRQYEAALFYSLPPMILGPPPYSLILWFGFSSAASDVDNPIKMTQDIIAKRYKFNDKLIDELHVYRRRTPKGKEFVRFSLHSIKHEESD